NVIRAASKASNPHSYGDNFSGSGRLGETNEPAPTINRPSPSPKAMKSRMGKYCSSTVRTRTAREPRVSTCNHRCHSPPLGKPRLSPNQQLHVSTTGECLGADGETRTPTAYATAPSRQRVY